MDKPADIPQAAWDASIRHKGSLNYSTMSACEFIARAIMSAWDEEREACAVLVEGGSKEFDFQSAWADMRDSDAGAMAARRYLAADIRKREAA